MWYAVAAVALVSLGFALGRAFPSQSEVVSVPRLEPSPRHTPFTQICAQRVFELCRVTKLTMAEDFHFSGAQDMLWALDVLIQVSKARQVDLWNGSMGGVSRN